MAFVGAPASALSRSTFAGGSVSHRPASSSRGPTMGMTEKEKKSFAPIWGGSAWREDVFTGGFPGGEANFQKWLEEGATGEVADLPDYLQPKDNKAPPKMPAGLSEEQKKSFAKIWGSSEWREDVFTGGFPGGEANFQKWLEAGGKADVPDLPDFLQPKSESSAKAGKTSVIGGVMDMLSDTFGGGKKDGVEVADGGVAVAAPPQTSVEPGVADSDAPSEALYSMYYPEATRNLAPFISIIDERAFAKDKVGVSMQEVTASAVDVHFPKQTKNKAPIITVDYSGNLATASVSVAMKEIEPLPTPAAPVAKGETVTTLVAGRGGGLRLQFDVEGEGPASFQV